MQIAEFRLMSNMRGGMTVLRKGTREKAFARRLTQALDRHPRCPPAYGRNTWLMRELTHHNVNVTIETIRKWLAGESMPRRAKMAALAKTLHVDEAWLAMGVEPGNGASVQDRVQELVTAMRLIAELTDDPKIQSIIASVGLPKSA